jgi:hypothetical protein
MISLFVFDPFERPAVQLRRWSVCTVQHIQLVWTWWHCWATARRAIGYDSTSVICNTQRTAHPSTQPHTPFRLTSTPSDIDCFRIVRSNPNVC